MIQIDIYSRPGCHLCDEAKAVIERVQRRFAFVLCVINVESDPALKKNMANRFRSCSLTATRRSSTMLVRPNLKRR